MRRERSRSENEERITSMQNPRVKHIVRLRDRQERDQSSEFVIEGYRELWFALEGGQKLVQLFICPMFFQPENNAEALVARAEKQGAHVYVCNDIVFQKLSYRDRPDGFLALAPQQPLTLEKLDGKLRHKKTPLIVVVEAVEKPGNLGAILRSADGAGADAVIVCDPKTDIYNPNVVRASVGTLFTLPVVSAESKEAIAWLKERNMTIVAATPKAHKLYTAVDWTNAVAVAVGEEHGGLSDHWLRQSTVQVAIPMKGVADSLNVAVSCTLLLYEAQRQRNAQ